MKAKPEIAPDKSADAGGRSVVVADRFVVEEKQSETNAAGGERSFAGVQQETVSNAALTRNGAQDAADALKTVSGVTVSRGSDGSNNISIRGMGPAFNRVTVDGQRQSNAGRFSGGSALDSLPPEILKSIEVTKSLTPDMDGDAIGGVVNLSTSNASELKAPLLKLKEQLTYHAFNPRIGTRTTATAGRPFPLWSAQPDSGILVTLGYDDVFRGYQFVESSGTWPALASPGPGPWAGQNVPAFTRVNVQEGRERRQRTTALVSADTRVGNSTFTAKFNYTRDASERAQSQVLFDVSNGTPTYLTPTAGTFTGVPLYLQGSDRNGQRDLTTLTLGQKTDAGRIHVTSSLGLGRTTDHLPDALYSNFVSVENFNVSYDARLDRTEPIVTFTTPTSPEPNKAYLEPSRYAFNQLYVLANEATDENASAQLDLKLDLSSDPQSTYLKFGVKATQLDRDVDQRRDVFGRASSAPLIGAQDYLRTASRSFRYSDYLIGPITEPSSINALVRTHPDLFSQSETETQLSTFGSDYTVKEMVGACYGLIRLAWRDWSLLTGLRAETTTFRTSAARPVFSSAGTPVAWIPISARREYTNVLPGLHLRYTPRPNLFFRASINRTLTRPDYGDLAPFYLSINYPVHDVRLGNPDLKPYVATNLDFSVDYYREKLGLLSAALFLKKIDNFQVDSQRTAPFADLGDFTQTQRINGGSARIGGVETSWRSDSFEVPGLLKKASVALTYTYLESRSRLPDRPAEIFPLPSQARNQASLSLRAERGRYSFDVAVTYRSKVLEAAVAEDRDRYQDRAFNLDLGSSLKLGKSSSLSAGLRNATAAPSVSYAGERSRPRYVQYNPLEAYFGVDWKL